MPTHHVSASAYCHKEHTCVTCSTVFRYRMHRAYTSKASSIDEGKKNARSMLECLFKNQSDKHPCPVCGLYQPEMFRRKESTIHLLTLVLTLGLFISLAGTSHYFQLTYFITTVLAMVIASLAVTVHLVASSVEPNLYLEQNLKIADEEVRQGELQIVNSGVNPTPNRMGVPKFKLGLGARVLFCAFSVFVFQAGDVLRIASGWSYNEDWYPPIVGQGDQSRFYMGHRLSIKKLWCGQNPSVDILNASELGVPGSSIQARTQDTKAWSQEILIKKGDEMESRANFYVELLMQDNQLSNLNGKTLHLDLSLSTLYPVSDTDKKFHEEGFSARQQTQLRLSPPGSGALYQRVWIIGLLAGAGLNLLIGLVFTQNALRSEKVNSPSKFDIVIENQAPPDPTAPTPPSATSTST